MWRDVPLELRNEMVGVIKKTGQDPVLLQTTNGETISSGRIVSTAAMNAWKNDSLYIIQIDGTWSPVNAQLEYWSDNA